jgi:hypothetical protein
MEHEADIFVHSLGGTRQSTQAVNQGLDFPVRGQGVRGLTQCL